LIFSPRYGIAQRGGLEMSEMFKAKVESNDGRVVEIELSQVHPDAPSLAWFAQHNVLWLVGMPAFEHVYEGRTTSFRPAGPLGVEIGAFDAVFKDDEGNAFISRYFDVETDLVRGNYNDDNVGERFAQAGLEFDPDDYVLTADVVQLVRGILRVKLTAKDPKWVQHLPAGRTWSL
jgi:hypothetical protein